MKQILTMMFLQNKLNQLITNQWYEQDQDFALAICGEANEFCDQIGWAWWKKQEPNWDQAKLELIDIWHFGIALAIRELIRRDPMLGVADFSYWESHLAIGGLVQGIADIKPIELQQLPGSDIHAKCISCMKKIMNHASDLYGAIDFGAMKTVMLLNGWDMNSVYKTFVGKNCLNIFRQLNGYKGGSYKKTWHGKEDNVALAKIMEWWDGESVEWIMTELQKEYATVV